ncbi:Hypothetical protein SCF082_LOCUS16477 [Durusdinium trenchii]|uniref:Uncharacterized protein n=1 Tax=Durusdinium trenchii TaxID=1381693 RepID=A0ABP0KBY9_9DINO
MGFTLHFCYARQGPSDAAEVMGLSRQLWSHWRAKHVALTSAERLYLALLADSRRLNALLAELSAVQGLADSAAPEEAGPPAGRAEALQKCQAQIQTQAKDAIDAFKERAKDYPCGWPHPKTDLLRIARTPEDLQSICEGFEASVLEQEKELLAQVEELLVADPRTLTSSLSRRVAFWEGQIEENWSQWSNQSSRFHEAQAGAVECWEQLRGKAYIMLAQQEASPQSREAQTEAVHKVFVEVACGLALLGAWASFHHLRGDGRILPELRDLLHSIITCLDIHFSGYQGRRAIEELLWENQSWRLVQAQPDIGRSESWWQPHAWPPRGGLSEQMSTTEHVLSEQIAPTTDGCDESKE